MDQNQNQNQNQKEYEEWKQKKLTHLEEYQDQMAEGEKKPEKEPRKSLGQEIWEYVRMIIIVVLAVVLIQNFIVINARIPSESMQDTIMVGDQIFGNRLAYKFGDPARYDIVIFRYPDDESELFIKRIIGLPGETVHIREDGVYIDDADQPLSQDFCPETPVYLDEDMVSRIFSSMTDAVNDGSVVSSTGEDGTVTEISYDADGTITEISYTVPEGSYFVMGDNRNHSHDSRYWNSKCVAEDKIVGKAFLRYWPLTAIKVLNTDAGGYYEPKAEAGA